MKPNITRVFFILRCFVFPAAALVAISLPYSATEITSSSGMLVLLGSLIVVLGIPHGALDAWVAEKIGLSRNQRTYLLFLSAYLACAAIVVTIWAIFPATSLLVFLVLSAIHFSEDWREGRRSIAHLPTGFLLLLMPIGFHTPEVAELFAHLSGPRGADLAYYLTLPDWLMVCTMLVLSVRAVFQRKKQLALELFTLLVLAHQVNPLIFFTLYFCLLHSPRHFLHLFHKAEEKEHARLFRIAFSYTVATLLLSSFLWWLWSELPLDSIVLRLTFISLAALTYPHMFLIYSARQWLESKSDYKIST